MQRECLLHFSLIKGTRLPSTDFLSKIDVYVKVKVLIGAAAACRQLKPAGGSCAVTRCCHRVQVNGALVGQTHVVSDKSDPVW